MHDPAVLTALSVAILAVTSVFVAVFAAEPWWRSAFGQSVMALAVAVWLFSLAAVLRQVLGPEYPGRVWLLGFSRLLVLVAITQRTVVLVRARWLKRS